MKGYTRRPFFLPLFLLCFSSFAQEPGLEEEFRNLLLIQRHYYPQEKAYLHFDRHHYITGDTIWFRGYVVDAATHVPQSASRYLYVDLLNPADSVVRRLRVRNEEGAYPGYFALPDDMPEGDYTVWAYTMFMRNAGEDYFFRAPVRISDPLSSKIAVEAAFSEEPAHSRLSVELGFTDVLQQTPAPAQTLRAGLNPVHRIWTADRTGTYRLNFRNVDFTKRNVLLTDYDKSRRYIQVPPPAGEFDVTFHPEGGYLTPGGVNVIAFKSLNAYGQSEDVTGEIFDREGNRLGSFVPDHKGMGTFNIYITDPAERYYAVCTNGEGISKRFDLPVVREDVTGLSAIQRGGFLFIAVSQPATLLHPDTLILLIHTRGVPVHLGQIDKSSITLRYDTRQIPSGISHILLMDRHGNILNERLIFIRNEDQARVGFSTDLPAYGYRMPVKATVRLKDPEGQPVMGTFSVAVTDDKDLPPDSTRNIYTELLLSSDLKGYIESPGWYFERDSLDRRRALDALMLTQGWRRYDLPALLKKEVKVPDKPLETGMTVSGRVKALLLSRPSAGTPIYMVVPSTGHIMLGETDDEGRFLFEGYEVPDSTGIFLQALSRKGKDRVEMIVDEDLAPPVLSALPGENHAGYVLRDQAYIAKADQKWSIENGIRTIHMEAVQVTGRKQGPSFNGPYSGLANNVYDTEYLEKWHIDRFESLLYMMPGVVLNGDNISIRGGGKPLFVIDDMIMDSEFDWRMEINMFDVERVELLKGPMAAIFGSRGGNGAILIYTKRGERTAPERVTFNRKVLTPLGYQKPAEFYAPRYETPPQKNSRKPDLRTTLYWNPSVRTDEQGSAAFDFYTADSPGTYSVVIEGVTDDGRVFHTVGKVVRQ